jgi:DNA alkylation repair enzyme
VTDAMRPLGTPERAAQEKRYLKSDLEFLGVSVPGTRRTVKAAARSYPDLDRDAALAWAIALRDPSSWPLIDAWASDQEFWVRRSALGG